MILKGVKFGMYDIDEHRHRLAVWAASRASTVKGCRYDSKQGEWLINSLGLSDFCREINRMPTRSDFDAWHRDLRFKCVKDLAKNPKLELPFTHGLAAKLINMYIKIAFVCGAGASTDASAYVHPPIDRILLKTLALQNVGGKRDFWKARYQHGWSKFGSDEYESVIENIKAVMGTRPLWAIEEYWSASR